MEDPLPALGAQLAGIVREMVELVGDADAREPAVRIDQANRKLVEIESHAFALLGRGQRRAAVALLFGDEYERQKQNYDEAIRLTVETVRA